MVIWLIGISGSGKTTIGRQLTSRLRAMGRTVIFCDGDIFRRITGDDLGFTLVERKKNADRICRYCKHLNDNHVDVVFGVLSLFHESQEWNRKVLGDDYFEVYLRTDLQTVMDRDPKGIYERARRGEIKNVVGVDIEFPEPERPDLVVENNGSEEDMDSVLLTILETMNSKGYLSK